MQQTKAGKSKRAEIVQGIIIAPFNKGGQGVLSQWNQDDDPPSSCGLRRTGGLLGVTRYVYKSDNSFSHY